MNNENEMNLKMAANIVAKQNPYRLDFLELKTYMKPNNDDDDDLHNRHEKTITSKQSDFFFVWTFQISAPYNFGFGFRYVFTGSKISRIGQE